MKTIKKTEILFTKTLQRTADKAFLTLSTLNNTERLEVDKDRRTLYASDKHKKVIDKQFMKEVASYSRLVSSFKCSKRDSKKLNTLILKCMNNARVIKYGNSRYINQTLNIIQKLTKLKPKALDNPSLKEQALTMLWVLYSHIEINGLDDSHYLETGIPCNEYGKLSNKNAGHIISKSYISSREAV